MSNAGESGSAPQPQKAGRRVLTGSLDDVDILSIAQFLVIQRKSGVLTLSHGKISAALWFENGQIINGRVQGYADGLESVRTIFKWKEGTFEFAPTNEKVLMLVRTDSQSLLMDLAIEADEMSRIIPASQVSPPPVTAPGSSSPPVRPAVVRIVRLATSPPPALARRVGSLPATPSPEQPQFLRRPFSQEEFVRQIEERLVIEDLELPSVSRERILHPRRKAPARLKPSIIFAVLGVPAALIITGVIAWVAATTGTAVNGPHPAAARPPEPPVVKEHKFVTAPNSPAYPIEKCIADLPFRCDLEAVELDRKDVRQVNIRLKRAVAWDENELALAIADDSIDLVQRIFDRQPFVDKIYIVARAPLSHELGHQEMDVAFKMTAVRSLYLSMKGTYRQMSAAKIIETFGGFFDKRLGEQ